MYSKDSARVNLPLVKSRFAEPKLIEGNGYETRQSSLYVFVMIFGPDPARNVLVT